MSDDQSPPDDDHSRERFERLLRTDHPVVALVREAAVSTAVVVLICLLLVGVSGVWPPMVAVESESMEPNVYRGDLVVVLEEHRLASDYATPGTGIVTYRTAARYETHVTFGTYGDVIVFDDDGDGGTPVIHRAHLWVEEGENWYGNADRSYVRGDSCEAMPNCPAPHAGFITKGDNNGVYDQVDGVSGPVRPSWIHGRAEVRIPLLGHVRLAVEGAVGVLAEPLPLGRV